MQYRDSPLNPKPLNSQGLNPKPQSAVSIGTPKRTSGSKVRQELNGASAREVGSAPWAPRAEELRRGGVGGGGGGGGLGLGFRV